MRPYSKQQERREMLKLMQRREHKTPEHRSPDWLARFWRAIAS